MERPVPAHETYGNVDHAIKKAKVEGMKSYASKTDIDLIATQVNLMRENAEIFKSIRRESEYNIMIANLLCQLSGVNRSAGMESSSTLTSCRGMEVDIMTDMATELYDDNSLEC